MCSRVRRSLRSQRNQPFNIRERHWSNFFFLAENVCRCMRLVFGARNGGGVWWCRGWGSQSPSESACCGQARLGTLCCVTRPAGSSPSLRFPRPLASAHMPLFSALCCRVNALAMKALETCYSHHRTLQAALKLLLFLFFSSQRKREHKRERE